MNVLVNKLHRYVSARLFIDFYTMVVVSPFIIPSIEGHCNLHLSFLVDLDLLHMASLNIFYVTFIFTLEVKMLPVKNSPF